MAAPSHLPWLRPLASIAALALVLALVVGSHAHADPAGRLPDPTPRAPEATSLEALLGVDAVAAGTAACVTDCKCVQERCPAGLRSCTACWWTEHSNHPCSPSDDEKQRYGFTCAASNKQAPPPPSPPPPQQQRPAPRRPAPPPPPPAPSKPICLTDCQCVQTHCPRGSRSCSACWWYSRSNTVCRPNQDEKARYGLSCARAGFRN